MGKICVMGSFVVDLTARTPHLPQKGETVIGSAFKLGPGGKGSNQAVAAKRAGGDVTIITKVGDDVFSRVAFDCYRDEGMDARYVFTDNELATGVALISVADDSSNSITVIPAACQNITDEEIESARGAIEGGDILLVQLEANMSATEKAVAVARAAKKTVVLNTAPVREVSDAFLAMTDIVTPNEVEAAILTGVSIETAADCRRASEWFFKRGVKKVVITWGSRGVYINDGENDAVIPVTPVDAVDSTGAGDAFNGAFVAGLAEGMSFHDAAVFGNVAAGLSVTRFGTAPATARRDEIEKKLAECAELFR